MAESETRDLTQTLQGVLEATTLAFESLLAPYEKLASADGDAALGSPLRLPTFGRSPQLKTLADRIEAGGRNAWALHQVETRESQLGTLLDDYVHGKYSATSVADWVSQVTRFRDGVFADIHTAMQAPRGWDRLNLAGTAVPAGQDDGEWLTPKDVAADLKLAERTVRRRVLEGKLGPWRKRGNRWVITRGAFHRFWERLLQDDDVPHPAGDGGRVRDPGDGLDHVRLDG